MHIFLYSLCLSISLLSSLPLSKYLYNRLRTRYFRGENKWFSFSLVGNREQKTYDYDAAHHCHDGGWFCPKRKRRLFIYVIPEGEERFLKNACKYKIQPVLKDKQNNHMRFGRDISMFSTDIRSISHSSLGYRKWCTRSSQIRPLTYSQTW